MRLQHLHTCLPLPAAPPGTPAPQPGESVAAEELCTAHSTAVLLLHRCQQAMAQELRGHLQLLRLSGDYLTGLGKVRCAPGWGC